MTINMSWDAVTLTTLENYLLIVVIVNICKDSSRSWTQTIMKYKFYKALQRVDFAGKNQTNRVILIQARSPVMK